MQINYCYKKRVTMEYLEKGSGFYITKYLDGWLQAHLEKMEAAAQGRGG